MPGDSPGNTCTAEDFTLTEVLVNNPPPSCTEGEIIPVGITLRIGMVPTATERYDIGIFVGNNANLPIGGASCTFSSLSPLDPPPPPPIPFDRTSGSGPYRNLDGDFCGDTLKTDGPVFKNVVLNDVLCQDINGDGKLDISYALTWKSGVNDHCANPDDPDDFIAEPLNKCLSLSTSLDDIEVIPPQPDLPSFNITKTPVPSTIHSGGEVTYSLSVNNDGQVSITLTSLTDNIFPLRGRLPLGRISPPPTVFATWLQSFGDRNPAFV